MSASSYSNLLGRYLALFMLGVSAVLFMIALVCLIFVYQKGIYCIVKAFDTITICYSYCGKPVSL